MDLPTYAATRRDPSGVDVRFEVFPRFFRVSLAATGEIVAEFGAAHIVKRVDWTNTPWPDAATVPRSSVVLDKYGGYRASNQALTPFVVRDVPGNEDCIRAVRAMLPADVSHMQRHDAGCGAAVVAILTGKPYGEVIRMLYPRGNVRALGTLRLANATGTQRCQCNSWEDAARANAAAVLIKDVHGGRRYGHYIAIRAGEIIDPELVLPYALVDYPRKGWQPLRCFVRP